MSKQKPRPTAPQQTVVKEDSVVAGSGTDDESTVDNEVVEEPVIVKEDNVTNYLLDKYKLATLPIDVQIVVTALERYSVTMGSNHPNNQATGAAKQYDLYNVFNDSLASADNSNICIDAIVWMFTKNATGAFSLDLAYRWAPFAFKQRGTYDYFTLLVGLFVSYADVPNRRKVLSRINWDGINKTIPNKKLSHNLMRYFNSVI